MSHHFTKTTKGLGIYEYNKSVIYIICGSIKLGICKLDHSFILFVVTEKGVILKAPHNNRPKLKLFVATLLNLSILDRSSTINELRCCHIPSNL